MLDLANKLPILQNLKGFLDRVELKGGEVPAFNEVIFLLSQIAEEIQQPKKEEVKNANSDN